MARQRREVRTINVANGTCRHQRIKRATPHRKSSAWIANVAALIAPADVPLITENGRFRRLPRIAAIAHSAPA
jgi:hypothetical protein